MAETIDTTQPISGWERVAMAIQRVRARLQRTVSVLDSAGIPYAVVGGNAVAEWVGQVDEGAVRFTRDVDVLIRREDLSTVIEAMEADGFVHHRTMEVDMFLDGPDARPSEAVHLIFAGEKIKPNHLQEAPRVEESQRHSAFSVVSLEALVGMKLTSLGDKDRTHIRDMIGVGLIDRSWLDRFPPALSQRLAEILDTPED